MVGGYDKCTLQIYEAWSNKNTLLRKKTDQHTHRHIIKNKLYLKNLYLFVKYTHH